VEPYTTARSQHLGGILLDANETAFGPLAPEADPELHRYPDPSSAGLKDALSRLAEAPPARLWVGNGSDEAIDVLVRALAAPGDRVVVAAPTYGVYAARARTHGIGVEEVRLDADYDLDVDRTAVAAEDAKLVFLCSPNNPTGNLLSEDRILELVRRTRCLVAVDEAYVEFAPRRSLAARAGDPERLAVLRTFSKAWGLAGARVGWLAGHPELVRVLDVVGLPYPLSRPAARSALRALELEEEMERRVRRVREERRRLRVGLDELGLEVAPSDANFLLFFVPEPGGVQRRLADEHGVVVRDRSGLPGLKGALRVTVGTPEENDRFLEGLGEVLGR
jgi:histidinol-phosphate aminotransferase